MKKSYFLPCILASIPVFFIFCGNAFGQCSASSCGTTNVSCNGAADGQACVSISGGTAPYNYVWSTGDSTTGTAATFNAISGLSGGTGTCPNCGDTVYTVTITDALGCVAVQSFTISEGPVLTGTVDSIIDASCFGVCDGKIYVSACGGTCPSSSLYLWDDGQTTPTATGLCAGNYTVRITAFGAGCDTIFLNSTVGQPDQLSVLTFGDGPPILCDGDSTLISVASFGGTGAHAYSWSHGLPDSSQQWVSPDTSNCYQQVNPLPPPCKTVYTVVVSDANGCMVQDSVVINVNYPLLVTKTEAEICEGESATISVIASFGNGGPYNYEWIPSGDTNSSLTVTPAVTTIYTVVSSDNCSPNDTTNVLVIVNKLPQVNFYSDKSIGCNIAFTDTSKGYSPQFPDPFETLIASWFWNFGDGTLMGPDSGAVTGVPNTSGTYKEPVHIYDVPGTYGVTVTVTDNSGCSITLTYNSMITCIDPTYVPNLLTHPTLFQVYPNPGRGVLTVEIYDLRFVIYDLRIYDILGSEIQKSKITNLKSEIDLSGQSAGIYHLQVITEKGVMNKKIMLE